MDMKTSKIELAKLILEIENPSLIQKIHELVTQETGNFRATLTEQEKEEIKLGISQLNEGKKVSFEEFLAKVS